MKKKKKEKFIKKKNIFQYKIFWKFCLGQKKTFESFQLWENCSFRLDSLFWAKIGLFKKYGPLWKKIQTIVGIRWWNKVWLASNKVGLDFYYNKLCIQVTSRVDKRLKTEQTSLIKDHCRRKPCIFDLHL